MAPGTPDRPPLCADYVMEGQFHAWPLAVPGECEPIEPDNAHICALAAAADGRLVWGAARGRVNHLFAACFKGAAGGIVDVGTLPRSTGTIDLLALPHGHALAGNGSHTVIATTDHGDRFSIWRQTFSVPRDAIQEPNFTHAEIDCLIENKEGSCRGLALLGKTVVCLTSTGLHALTNDPPTLNVVSRHDSRRALTAPAVQADAAWWIDENGTLNGWRIEGAQHPWTPRIGTPGDSLSLIPCPPRWLLATLPDGTILVVDPLAECVETIALAPLPGVQCLAALTDGRVYGLCGSGIGHFFRIDLGDPSCTALGAVATAMGNHRYAFTFSCADVSADGVIFLGEDDRGGHLWTYYPPLTTA